jgi:glycosyltransferase involved in cell wall biosynthesis
LRDHPEDDSNIHDLIIASGSHRDDDVLDISVVMPCLNEERSVAICVGKAWAGIRSTGLSGEVIVVDNGSTDGSAAAAEAAGARVVHHPRRGYGNACREGFSAASGRIIIMGDCDDSYDFTAIPDLIRPIDEGSEYVLGSRFTGKIHRRAMTWSHRYVGNPVLTAMLNVLFGLRVSDAHSGYRAITRSALKKLSLQCEGMEFASEIVVKAARAKLRTAEVPITYNPRIGVSKLNSFRDAWRHVRFLLMLSPFYLFVVPGILFTAAGVLGQIALSGMPGSYYVLVTKVMLALVALSGSQLLTLGLFAKTYANGIGLENRSRVSEWVEKTFTLEHGLVAGAALAALGVMLIIYGFIAKLGPVAAGGPSASVTILGLLSLVLGGTVWFDAFFLSIVLLRRPTPEITVFRDSDSESGESVGGIAVTREGESGLVQS